MALVSVGISWTGGLAGSTGRCDAVGVAPPAPAVFVSAWATLGDRDPGRTQDRHTILVPLPDGHTAGKVADALI